MRSQNLNTLLNQLKLIENKAVFFRDEVDGEVFADFSSDINKKLELIKPDAYYVFNNQPFILFFDLTSIKSLERETEIHKQVWSFDNSPIIFIIKATDIEVYNALNFIKENGKLERIKILDSKIQDQFSFWNLQSGATFEWFYQKHKATVLKKRVNHRLFENIKQTILILNEKYSLAEIIAKEIILKLIFIRYLIDREIKIDTNFIQGDEKEVIKRRKSFSELIKNPKKLVSFFKYLDTRFNGVLFKQDSIIELTQEQANILSKLFNPDGVTIEDKKNLFSDFDFQFEVFDFGIIPVELISGIYETLLDEETKNATSAVYTPPFLVDYILTQTVDKYFDENKSTSECKIFDPAMGSGIFLVQGLRRMIEREKELNPNDDNETFGEKIKKIAEQNLFGIDINPEAINVACFSIYVALLDYQEPGNIDVYKFPHLKDNNFFKAHFFDLTKEEIWKKIKSENVNFILGNPPWKNNSSPEHLDWLKKSKFDKIVSDKQIAQSYLIRIKDFVNENTTNALIVTSKVFYNNKAQKFKKYFLENSLVTEIFDLSPVRHLVFENADNPGAIVFFKVNWSKEELNSESIIKHISLKQNKYFNKFSKNLIIEKFDRKQIKQKFFIDNHWMFKVALYGNTLDYLLLNRIGKINFSIEDFVSKNYSIKSGNGIHKGTPKRYFTDLIGIPIIETDDIQKFYTPINEYTKTLKIDDVYLEAGRKKSLFEGNKILFTRRPKKETEISASICEKDSVFRNSAYGIPLGNNKDFVSQVYSYINTFLYTYYQYLTSSNWGVYNPEINLNEYLSFPYIEPNETQKAKLTSLVDDLLKPYKDFYNEYPNKVFQGEPNKGVLNEINSIIEEIYDIKGYEKDLIDYVLNVSRYQFQDSKQHLVSDFNEADYRNKETVLKSYVDVYIKEFEKIYDDSFFKVEIYELGSFITMNFIVLDEKPQNFEQIEFVKEVTDEKKLFEKLSTLSISKIASSTDSEFNLFIQKDIKGFEENSFYIIKPKEYKCWHRAMAWYDVAEFKEAIQKAELEHFKNESK
jgi:hypothetical protein